MEQKPIITSAGDIDLFAKLEHHLVQSMPSEPTDWQRSYGRPVKPVYTEASFIEFKESILPKESDRSLIKQPIFHIYWTECMDVDVYKSSVHNDIESWLRTLSQHNIDDWLIVLVETYDNKRSNKLIPRATVLDKIRSDFGSKQPDRCISVINPLRSESRSAATWRGLLCRIRILLLTAYDSTMVRFEETIRKQRERRKEPGWSFCQYFLLQEELAFVLEMLGLYDEALIQYDELDALFTQFVLNSSIGGEMPQWLTSFQKPLDQWPGLHLTHKIDEVDRKILQEGKASLLQFRAYLFTRQCAMLLLTFQPSEIAQRTLPFLHNCISELRILDVSCPPGSVACWVYLGCLEVLHTCERFTKNEHVQAYSRHTAANCERFTKNEHVQAYSRYTAALWAYASEKLNELGKLCGLLPGLEPTSEQLHLVVGLSAGMGDSPRNEGEEEPPTPTDKLKRTLSSQEAFIQHYLELAELAMGTYKHIGRLRLARKIGCDLASFYGCLSDHHKACTFLDTALQYAEAEGWHQLATYMKQEFARCCQRMGDKEKYAKMCVSLGSSKDLSIETRNQYLGEMKQILDELKPGCPIVTPLSDAVRFVSVKLLSSDIDLVPRGTVTVALVFDSLLPNDLLCQQISLYIKKLLPKNSSIDDNFSINSGQTSSSNESTFSDQDTEMDRSCTIHAAPANLLQERLSFQQRLEYRQDKCLGAAFAACKDPVSFFRRVENQSSDRKSAFCEDSDGHLQAQNVVLRPGINEVTVKVSLDSEGVWKLSHVSLLACDGRLSLVSEQIPQSPGVGFVVKSKPPTVNVKPVSNEEGCMTLTAGVEQHVVLKLNAGSQRLSPETNILLKASPGLSVQLAEGNAPFQSELQVPLPPAEPFDEVDVPLRLVADVEEQHDESPIEGELKIEWPWSSPPEPMQLVFSPPFYTTFRLHTAGLQKFAQVLVSGLNETLFQLRNPSLVATQESDCEPWVHLTSLNPNDGQPLVACGGTRVSFLWEIDLKQIPDVDPVPCIQTTFTTEYGVFRSGELQWRRSQCTFDIIDYKTLLIANVRVEPTKGNEFCRASHMCQLHLTVQWVNKSHSPSNPLMYEVLINQNLWAVCGRTVGVISFDNSQKQTVVLDVMPLQSGFLPLPRVRISKYFPADQKLKTKDGNRRTEGSALQSRSESFSTGQVFNNSKAQQVHVLPSVVPGDTS